MDNHRTNREISDHWWGYIVLASRFMLFFMDAGIAKSFGVLIPGMVERLGENYATVGLICSLPATLLYLVCPFVTPILERVNHRAVAMAGGLMSGLCLIASAFITSTGIMGVCLATTGIGLSLAYMPTILVLNDYFPETFVTMNAVSLFGYTAGAMFLPVIIERAFEAYDYEGAFLILGGIVLNVVVCGAVVRKPKLNRCRRMKNDCNDLVDDTIIGVDDTQIGVDGHREDVCDSSENNATDLESPNGISYYHVEQNVKNKVECETANTGAERTCLTRTPDIPNECSPMIQESESDDACGTQSNLLSPIKNTDTSQPVAPQSRSSVMQSLRETFIFQEPIFWFFLPSFFLVGYVIYAWMLFLVPNAEERGIDQSQAVLLSTIAGVGGIGGRIIFIILTLVWKVDVFMVYIIVGAVCSASFFLDFAGSSFAVRAVLALVQGFCLFIEDTYLMTVTKELEKKECNFNRSVSLGTFVVGLGATTAGFVTGYIYDVTQSYTKVFVVIGFIQLLVVFLITAIKICLGRRKR